MRKYLLNQNSPHFIRKYEGMYIRRFFSINVQVAQAKDNLHLFEIVMRLQAAAIMNAILLNDQFPPYNLFNMQLGDLQDPPLVALYSSVWLRTI